MTKICHAAAMRAALQNNKNKEIWNRQKLKVY